MKDEEVGLIAKALRASWPRVSAGIEESGFRQQSIQVIGRLSSAREGMAGVKACLDSVRERAARPRMAPLEECLARVDESVEEVYVGSEVEAVASAPEQSDCGYSVWRVVDGGCEVGRDSKEV